MKIRMTEHSVRLRVGRSELARFLEVGRIEETVRFAPAPEASFTYGLESFAPGTRTMAVCYRQCGLTVFITPEQVALWRKEDEVGIYARDDTGTDKALEVIVEKDFDCLNRNDSQNADAFPNPSQKPVCA